MRSLPAELVTLICQNRSTIGNTERPEETYLTPKIFARAIISTLFLLLTP